MAIDYARCKVLINTKIDVDKFITARTPWPNAEQECFLGKSRWFFTQQKIEEQCFRPFFLSGQALARRARLLVQDAVDSDPAELKALAIKEGRVKGDLLRRIIHRLRSLAGDALVWCLNCGATMVSAGRFLDQESLGAPRSFDSEILTDVENESTDEQITQQAVPDEELDDAEMLSIEEQAAGIDISRTSRLSPKGLISMANKRSPYRATKPQILPLCA